MVMVVKNTKNRAQSLLIIDIILPNTKGNDLSNIRCQKVIQVI